MGVLAAAGVPSGARVFPFHGVLDHGAVQYEEGKDWRYGTPPGTQGFTYRLTVFVSDSVLANE